MSAALELTAPLPWQCDQWRRVQSQFDAGRLPHALLLHGAAGLGKEAFAKALAARLLCANPLMDMQGLVTACGACSDCRQVVVGSHPDQHRVQPDAVGRPIRIEQVRRLEEFVTKTRQRSAVKVGLLLTAEQLNANAANALLKTLEEPPPTSLLVLVCNSVERLPATVRSRCHQIAFRRPSWDTALGWLRSRPACGYDAELVLRLADGVPLRALAQADTLSHRIELFRDWQAVLCGQRAISEVAARWAGDSARNVGWLLSWHQDMIRLKMGLTSTSQFVNKDLAPALAELAAPLSGAELFRRLDGLHQLVRVHTTSANVALQLAAWLATCTSRQNCEE